eukprot:2114357-Rhodomonas_salina.2
MPNTGARRRVREERRTCDGRRESSVADADDERERMRVAARRPGAGASLDYLCGGSASACLSTPLCLSSTALPLPSASALSLLLRLLRSLPRACSRKDQDPRAGREAAQGGFAVPTQPRIPGRVVRCKDLRRVQAQCPRQLLHFRGKLGGDTRVCAREFARRGARGVDVEEGEHAPASLRGVVDERRRVQHQHLRAPPRRLRVSEKKLCVRGGCDAI